MNRQFPALSGVAMLLIVLNHTIQMGTTVPVSYGFAPVEGPVKILLHILQGFGVFAVPTFLFISGTFVSYAARGRPPSLSVRFLGRGLAHLLPPYLFWSAVFYIVVLLQFREVYSPAGYVKNVLVGYPYHFIPLLLLFYLLAPLLVRIGRRHALPLLIVIGGYQLLLSFLLHAKLTDGLWGLLIPPGLSHTLADWAVYFPLGLVYGLHSPAFLPVLRRLRRVLLLATIVFFVLAALHYTRVLSLPPAGSLSALSLVLLLPLIDRGSIPLLAKLEEIGKRSYGLYLTHLIVLDLVLLAIGKLVPGLFSFQLVLLPLLYLVALLVPLSLMRGMLRFPVRMAYRYIMG
ncbi:MAG: acyltransferase family protein [Acidobacteriota bacterium]